MNTSWILNVHFVHFLRFHMLKLGDHLMPYSPISSRTHSQVKRKWAETEKHINSLLQKISPDWVDQAFLEFMDTVILKENTPPVDRVVQRVTGTQHMPTAQIIYQAIGWSFNGIKVCKY